MPVTVEQEPALIDLGILRIVGASFLTLKILRLLQYLITFSLVVAVVMLDEFLMMFCSVTGLYPLLQIRLLSLSCGTAKPEALSRREDVERTSQAIQQLSFILFIVLSSSDSS